MDEETQVKNLAADLALLAQRLTNKPSEATMALLIGVAAIACSTARPTSSKEEVQKAFNKLFNDLVEQFWDDKGMKLMREVRGG